MRKNQKWCWQAREYRKGWRLGLVIGNSKPKYIQHWFDFDDIAKVVKENKTLYIHLAIDSSHCPTVKWSGGK